MPGGVFEIVGVLALLIAVAELIAWLLPRRLLDEMQDIVGDRPSPVDEPEVQQLRRRGAL